MTHCKLSVWSPVVVSGWSWVVLPSFCPRHPFCSCVCFCGEGVCVCLHMCCCPLVPSGAICCNVPSACLMPLPSAIHSAFVISHPLLIVSGQWPCVVRCGFTFFLSQTPLLLLHLFLHEGESVCGLGLQMKVHFWRQPCTPGCGGGGSRKSWVASESTLRKLFPVLMS